MSYPKLPHRALYAAFDVYPSAKGAATHIHKMAQTLFDTMQGGLLYVLGHSQLPVYQREKSIEIIRYNGQQPNLLKRTLSYGSRLYALLDRQQDSLRICHFRDPWSGVPILDRNSRQYKVIYEVNGLPSIELPESYPLMSARTIEKIHALEKYCLDNADNIITPSKSIQNNLISLGVRKSKISVIHNGAEIPKKVFGQKKETNRYLIYFGALQSWQGVDILLKAFARLIDIDDLRLVICSSVAKRHARGYKKLAKKLGIATQVQWYYQLPKHKLNVMLGRAELSIAPLTDCPRNVCQGCCPLKILESMAAGVPVVASDLASVRELMKNGRHGLLVRPDRPDELARTIRIMLEYPERRRHMGNLGRRWIKQYWTWDKATQELKQLYGSIVE